MALAFNAFSLCEVACLLCVTAISWPIRCEGGRMVSPESRLVEPVDGGVRGVLGVLKTDAGITPNVEAKSAPGADFDA